MTDLRSSYTEHVSKEISEYIDFMVLVETLGMYVITLESVGDRKRAIDIADWCRENLTPNRWRRLGRVFAFDLEEEASMFTMKWAL